MIEAFAELWVENRSEFRPRGSRMLRAELRQKGIPDRVISSALEGLDEASLALKAARKKARRYRELEWHEFRKKLYGFLARRGFHYGVISEVVRKYLGRNFFRPRLSAVRLPSTE